MQYKTERNQVNFPVSKVAFTREEEVITHIHVEIENSNFDYNFDDETELQIIAKVLTGKISPHEGFKQCCDKHYSYASDVNSYPSAVLLRHVLGNSKECRPFIKGDILNEMNPYIGNTNHQTYGFSL